jgi:hypothetical protein
LIRGEFDAKREQQRFVVRESHPVRLPRVALDLGNELFLVLATHLEAAFALEHPFHDSSRRG